MLEVNRNKNKIACFFSDCAVMSGRSIKNAFRYLDTLIMTAVVPVMILLVFTYLFGGAVALPEGVNYLNFVVPGVIILSVGYSASATSIGINSDFKSGIVDRFRSMPIARSSFLVGHIIAALLRNICSTVLLLIIAVILGFRPQSTAGSMLTAIFVLVLFAFAITSLAAMFGLIASTPDGAGIFGFAMMFLPYLSSAFVPIESMPVFLQGISRHQPISIVLESLKALLNGTYKNVFLSAIWCVSLSVISLAISVILFKRKTGVR